RLRDEQVGSVVPENPERAAAKRSLVTTNAHESTRIFWRGNSDRHGDRSPEYLNSWLFMLIRGWDVIRSSTTSQRRIDRAAVTYARRLGRSVCRRIRPAHLGAAP